MGIPGSLDIEVRSYHMFGHILWGYSLTQALYIYICIYIYIYGRCLKFGRYDEWFDVVNVAYVHGMVECFVFVVEMNMG